MRKFKVGDEVKVVEITLAYAGNLKVGDTAIIKKFQINQNRFVMLVGDDSNVCCWHDVNNIELVKPKWSIYNNTLPWSQLSDKQKGKLLVADNLGLIFNGFTIKIRPSFGYYNSVYAVTNPDTVKPEPTMTELLTKDVLGCSGFLRPHDVDDLIAKGWTKPCK
jgi:hypothetical protein